MDKEEILQELHRREAWQQMSKDELLIEYQRLNCWHPDWRDESQYSDYRFAEKYKRTKDKQYKDLIKGEDLNFAWQFLRRNKNYQDDFYKLWI